MTKKSRVRISSIPPFSVEYLAQSMKEACDAFTLQAQKAQALKLLVELVPFTLIKECREQGIKQLTFTSKEYESKKHKKWMNLQEICLL